MESIEVLAAHCSLSAKEIREKIRKHTCTHVFEVDGYDYVCVQCGLLGTPLYAVPKRDF